MKPYFQDAAITIYHGDCREVLPTIDVVDHIITDPPYEKEAHTKGRRAYTGTTSSTFAKGVCEERPISFAAITEGERTNLTREAARICGGWVMVFSQVEAVHLWRLAMEAYGVRYTRTQLWVKPDATPQFTGDRPAMAFECIVTGWARKTRMEWNGGGTRGLYTHMTVKAGEHETQKPLALMAQLVDLFSNPGELILDPFTGSGTTLRAAKDLGRRAIGIELDERYCEIAARRMGQEVLNFGVA